MQPALLPPRTVNGMTPADLQAPMGSEPGSGVLFDELVAMEDGQGGALPVRVMADFIRRAPGKRSVMHLHPQGGVTCVIRGCGLVSGQAGGGAARRSCA